MNYLKHPSQSPRKVAIQNNFDKIPFPLLQFCHHEETQPSPINVCDTHTGERGGHSAEELENLPTPYLHPCDVNQNCNM